MIVPLHSSLREWDPVSQNNNKWENYQIHAIKHDKQDINDSTEIQTTIRKYYKQLYVHKPLYLEEMNNFLDTYTSQAQTSKELQSWIDQ